MQGACTGINFGLPRRLLKKNRASFRELLEESGSTLERMEPTILDPQPVPSCSGSDRISQGCPVYVMLPLDTVWILDHNGCKESMVRKQRSLEVALHTLKQAGVEGVMVDVWWGIAERSGPGCYDFSAYQTLFQKVARAGLKVRPARPCMHMREKAPCTCCIQPTQSPRGQASA